MQEFNKKIKINMLYGGENIKGQGVLSATQEQNKLCQDYLDKDKFDIQINSKSKNYDIFHVHTINPTFYFNASKYKKHGVLVGHVHCIPETVENSIKLPKLFKKAFYKYMLGLYKSFEYIVTVNPVFIDKLNEYGINKDKITYIPNYVDNSLFYPDPNYKTYYRQKYDLDTRKFTVLCAGQLQTRKGIFDFIEISKKYPDIQFVWAGGFSFKKISDGYKEINKILKDHPENVKFLGIIERENMNEVFNLADVFFLPSYEELFPMTILEAFAAHIPVITRDLDYFPQILFDYYLKGNNNFDFETLILKLKDDQNFYKQQVNKSIEGNKKYSKESIGAMWDEFYTKVYQENQTRFKRD